MKRVIVIVVLIAMLGWAIYDFGFHKDDKHEEAEIGIQVGDIAPDFELRTLNGEQARLADFRGEKVMLNFWATWCPPCRAEMPDMERFYHEEDVVILAVNLTESETNLEKIETFVEEYGLSFPVLLDEEAEISDLYEVNVVPTSFMIHEDGRINYKIFGPMNKEMMKQEYEKMHQ